MKVLIVSMQIDLLFQSSGMGGIKVFYKYKADQRVSNMICMQVYRYPLNLMMRTL